MMPPESRPPITIVAFLGGPGLPSYSPFCCKAVAVCRLLGVPHVLEIAAGPPKSKTGKLPYVPLEDGTFVEGSDAIVDWLRTARGLDADAGLTAQDQATSHMARRTIEEHLYFAILNDRWLSPSGFAFVKAHYFGGLPAVARDVVPWMLQRQVRRDVHGQGLSRMDPRHVALRVDQDLDSLAALLGDGDWYLGDRPTLLDAVSWAFLANVIGVPLEGPVAAAVRARPRLVSHCARFAAAFDLSSHPAPAAEGG